MPALYWDSPYYGPWNNSDLTEGGKFIRDLINNNLIKTDFSEGADGWYLNDREESSADVEFLNEEAHIFYYGIASANNYGQQFCPEDIEIVNGITYTPTQLKAAIKCPGQPVLTVMEAFSCVGLIFLLKNQDLGVNSINFEARSAVPRNLVVGVAENGNDYPPEDGHPVETARDKFVLDASAKNINLI